MDEYTPFWIIFSVILGILYFHFSIAKIPVISKLTQSLLNIRDALKSFTRGKFTIGIVLIGFSQFNLLTPGPSSYLSVHGLFSISLTDKRFSLDIVNSADALANILLLLAGCFLLVSALRDANAIPEEKEPALLFGKIFGFSKGRLLTMSVAGFALSFYLLWQLYNQSEEFYLIAVWLIAIFLFGYLAFQLDFQNGVFHGPHIRRSDVLWLAGLLLLGLLVGMYRLQSIPNQLIPDEIPFWLRASEIWSNPSPVLRQWRLFFSNSKLHWPGFRIGGLWHQPVVMAI
jgi:hypothetical protein